MTTTRRFRIKPIHVLLPVAGLLALGAMAQKRASGFLNYYIKGLQIAYDNYRIILRVRVNVQNPSNEQFTIRSISGNVFANGEKIGLVSMFETVVINPNAQTELPLDILLDPVGAVSELITLIQ